MSIASKKCAYYRDTHRVTLGADIQACNECGGWETKSDTWRQEAPILHKTTCSFYPSLANLELEERLKAVSRVTAYYNEIDPFAAEWLRELIKAGHIAPGSRKPSSKPI